MALQRLLSAIWRCSAPCCTPLRDDEPGRDPDDGEHSNQGMKMRSSQALSCVGTVKLYIGAPITKTSTARNSSSASSPASLPCGPSGPPTPTPARGWSDGSRSSTSDLTHVFRRSNCDAVALRQAGKEAAHGVWCPGHRRADLRHCRSLRTAQHRQHLRLPGRLASRFIYGRCQAWAAVSLQSQI